ncbi:hypothetical protein ACJMK2_025592 [Sinanodonta woodiana]|uniref:lysozyme n=1 Tax=Sinanodonta woodiana TaxID=1069815 RepID=A0ABD3XIW4_SINWO
MFLVTLTIAAIVATATATDVEKRAHSFHTGIVPQNCMECICQVDSGCQPIRCTSDVNSDSCGYFQIKEPYWIDCGRLGGDWHTCANDLECSSSREGESYKSIFL